MIENKTGYFSGFTLVELMISMAILSIMAALTIVSMTGAKTKQEVEGAARQVAAAVREAQNYALTGKNIGASGDVPCQFRLDTTGSAISIQQRRFSSPGLCNVNSGSPTVYPLPTGVAISIDNVSFNVPRGEVFNDVLLELDGNEKIDFAISKNGEIAHVCVYPFGRIEERPIGGSCI
jgi:prepilin-type N-terminal cleavage/methylation domain-containing protein